MFLSRVPLHTCSSVEGEVWGKGSPGGADVWTDAESTDASMEMALVWMAERSPMCRGGRVDSCEGKN